MAMPLAAQRASPYAAHAMTTPELIDDPTRLRERLAPLHGRDWFALDTEFIREETYWPQLCLIQIATPDDLFCIDPLAVPDLEPLEALLFDPGITKVLHAAGQDLEIFHHRRGEVPAPVFDTQLAAPLLGHPEQAGFARLVHAVLGVELAKGHARTDWTRRPLPEAALRYAADDVRYLVPLYEHIRDALAARGRSDWLEPELARLTDPERYDPPVDAAWRRIKGADRLTERGRAVLQAVAAWREETARANDVPRGRIGRDDGVLDLARQQPTTRRQLGHLRSVRGALSERHGDALVAAVAGALGNTAPTLAAGRPPKTLDEGGEALVDALSAIVRLRAQALDLNPASLATRKELTRIAAGTSAHEVLGGWRAGLVADDLDGLVAGRSTLQTDQGRLVIAPR